LTQVGTAEPATSRGNGKQRGQASRVLFQQFDAEKFSDISGRARACQCTPHT